MVSTGDVHPTDLARLVGAQTGLRYVDLELEPADPTLANAANLDFYIAERCVPWRWVDRETVYVATDLGKIVTGIPLPRPRPTPSLTFAWN